MGAFPIGKRCVLVGLVLAEEFLKPERKWHRSQIWDQVPGWGYAAR